MSGILVRLLSWTLVSAVTVAGLAEASANTGPLGDDEYIVLNAVLTHVWGDALGPILISDRTESACLTEAKAASVRKDLEDDNPLASFPDDLFAAFSQICDSNLRIDPARLNFYKATLLPPSELKHREDGIRLTLSRVAFSADRTKALLVMTDSYYSYESQCLVVQRIGGAWRIVARATVDFVVS